MKIITFCSHEQEMYEKLGDTVVMCVIRERKREREKKKTAIKRIHKKRVDGNGISKYCLHGNGVAKQRREKKYLRNEPTRKYILLAQLHDRRDKLFRFVQKRVSRVEIHVENYFDTRKMERTNQWKKKISCVSAAFSLC